MKTAPKPSTPEPWELGYRHIFASHNHIYHAVESIERDGRGDYTITARCGFAFGRFYDLDATTGFYLRRTRRKRFCRRCAAVLREEHAPALCASATSAF